MNDVTWKPITEYPCVTGSNIGPLVLARYKDGHNWLHLLVVFTEGHFHTLPQQWFYYVDHRKWGPCYADHVEEFIEIPK